MIRAAQPWGGGGMSPLRLDRAEVRRRCGAYEPWVVDELMDAFEPAALAAMEEGRKARRQKEDRDKGAARPERKPQTEEGDHG